ncbi:MAG: DNA mismatch repair protein MutS [Candidatus Peregrinibacteria bacterium]|nr:DNA mismatch repair protein MutS [Candidatus Peregrinibacteria bacterium]
MSKLTPMMSQYRKIKDRYQDCILFFRLGDFYEMFEEDAERAAKILQITLTSRNGTPMCGVPYHAVENYLAKLTSHGEKVALCEQVSDPALPGIVERDVVRVVTPGTTFSEALLDNKSNNFTLAIYPKRDYFGIATIDITTGSFFVTELRGYDQLANELQRLQPRECIVPVGTEDQNLATLLEAFEQLHAYTYQTSHDAYQTLQEHFDVNSLEAFGIDKWPFAIQAAGLLMNYLKDTQKAPLTHLKKLTPYSPDDHMILDEATMRNLELVSTIRDSQKKGSLLGVLDHTQTAMGGRLLRNWILRPLTNKDKIGARLAAVETFCENYSLHQELREEIEKILDLERVLSRLTLDRGTPRDLVALKVSLQQIPTIKQALQTTSTDLLRELNNQLKPLPELVDLINRAIIDEPPLNLREGGFMKDGFDTELDELRTLSREGKGFIKTLQQREIERSGINSLKVKYNRVFGYYIEISKSNLGSVPEDYIRKQTLVNAERYITPELKEYEEKVLTAEDKSKALEMELFKNVRFSVMEEMRDIQENAEAIAKLDVLLTFAHVAGANRYQKPTLTDDQSLTIVGGRHAVVESMNPAGDFVPNDTLFDDKNQQIILLTGPNMSGKSTLLRQVALITLMAQIGSYVPAQSAEIGVVDRIFTRVGASDNLVRGQSTFMVEMQEAANILNNATDRSLVILDEIGRGTSTYDGVSIAWAILEYLHDHVGAKTLFASHYHELIAVADRLEKAANFSVAVHEDTNRGVIFLHKIRPGGIDKSYGIEVAKLAGLPNTVIRKAQHILTDLEEGVMEKSIQNEMKATHDPYTNQAELFELGESGASMMERPHGKLTHPALERLKEIDVNRMTPLEALQTLEELGNL